MALIKCSECRKKISSSAQACPSCGAPVDSDPANKQVKRDRRTKIAAWIILPIVALSLIGAIFGENENSAGSQSEATQTVGKPKVPSPDSTPDEPDWKTRDNSSMAYIMVEDFVKRRLKAPSTADFPSAWSGRGKMVDDVGNQTYAIDSYVDAQNSFGAQIRMRFAARIKQVSEREWQLIALDMAQ